MRRLLKFLHTMGAIGLMGSMASLLAMAAVLPDPESALTEYTAIISSMCTISLWVFAPSLAMTIVSGLFSMAATPAFHDAGWALLKLVMGGLFMFEWGLLAIYGPIRREAELTEAAMASGDISQIGADGNRLLWALLVLLAITTLNVILGIWRPKFSKRRTTPTGDVALSRKNVPGDTQEVTPAPGL